MYRNGKRNGFGKAYYLSDGKIKDYFHSGQYLDGQRHGYGVFKYPNGDRYEGNYRKDKREGIGTYFHASGSNHTG